MQAQEQQTLLDKILANFAKKIYTELSGDRNRLVDKEGFNIIAALYVPDRGVRLSTMPRGNTEKVIDAA